MSCFSGIPPAPSDSIFGLMAQYHQDSRSCKVDLTAGIYKNESLKTPILKVVKQIESHLLTQEGNKEYLPIEGDKRYLELVSEMVFGKTLSSVLSECISGFQTVGGTGALRIAGEFIKHHIGEKVYVSDPSWPNHRGVFSQAGLTVGHYPYYNRNTNGINFTQMEQFLKQIPPKSVVLLHAGCHNPTGKDLSHAEWEMIYHICREGQLIPFFDAAYLGFHGTPEEDAYPIRLFAKKGIEMMVAVSFSKTFSLYGERIGALFVLSASGVMANNITSQIKIIIRRNYSNPPMHGMHIVAGILNDPLLKAGWLGELAQMRERIASMKKQFSLQISSKVVNKDYTYLQDAKGMFCFCSLDPEAVERLKREYAVYMTEDSRVNLAGLIPSNIDYVVDSIAKVIG